MYELARPKMAIPVHGEFLHTKTHCTLAKDCGVERSIQIENGLAVLIDGNNLDNSKKVGFVKSGYFAVDGRQLINFNSEVIRQRKKLQHAGIINISVAVNHVLEIIGESRILATGSYDLDSDDYAYDMLENELRIILKNKSRELGLHKGFSMKFLSKNKKKRLNHSRMTAEIEKTIRSKMLKIFQDLMGKRPAIEVFVHLID
jgi:mRNA degradation ribonuclease J1/J2